jgi:hypothetical protein
MCVKNEVDVTVASPPWGPMTVPLARTQPAIVAGELGLARIPQGPLIVTGSARASLTNNESSAATATSKLTCMIGINRPAIRKREILAATEQRFGDVVILGILM